MKNWMKKIDLNIWNGHPKWLMRPKTDLKEDTSSLEWTKLIYISSQMLRWKQCVWLPIWKKQDNGEVTFVIGKCWVAPSTDMTVAKLEMQVTVFGVRLRELLLEEHDIGVDQIGHCTNSTTVLQCLHASNNKQPDFVANRVARNSQNFNYRSVAACWRKTEPRWHWHSGNDSWSPKG